MRSLWTFLCVVLLFAPGVNAQGTITTVAGTGWAVLTATAFPPPAPAWPTPLAWR